MFRPTRTQTSLLESRFLVPPEKRARLERSWAEAFRLRVLPLIDEEAFRACYCEDNGRPNKSIRLLVGLLLLKEADDLTDAAALEALEFNLLWQHALGVTPEEAHVAERTLNYFRRKLMENDRAKAVFEQVTTALMKADGLSAVRQRLDSTHVLSNIAVLTRLGLFVETVTTFLRELHGISEDLLARVSEPIRKRYLDREGYFADAKREVAKRRLPVVARDLFELVQHFAADKVVSSLGSYALMKRLLDEQCEVSGEADEEPVRLREPKEIGGSTLQSPHDPDATYGHKGKGYELQLAETCVDTNPYQVVTTLDVTGAHVSDIHATVGIVEGLAARDLRPETLLADTAYSGGENIVVCAELGTTLLAPVQDPTAEAAPDPFLGEPAPEPEPSTADLGAFTFNATYDQVITCPAGHAPMEQHVGENAFFATFAADRCASCPLADTCPARRLASGERRLRWRDRAAATATRQRIQDTAAFKEEYRDRSGIESTNAELKGRHGAKKLRVRRAPRVSLALHLKVLALNVKRAVQHHLRLLLEQLQPAPTQLGVT